MAAVDGGGSGQVVSHGRARTLARVWSIDPESLLELFVATGEISRDLIAAVDDDLHRLDAAAEVTGGGSQPQDMRNQLRALVEYLMAHGERGPVTAWELLTDNEPWVRERGQDQPTAELHVRPGRDRA